MDEPKNDTCAVLDANRERLARGRFDAVPDGGYTFKPASNVTAEEMKAVAFLWPDGEDAIAVSGARPATDGGPTFHLDA